MIKRKLAASPVPEGRKSIFASRQERPPFRIAPAPAPDPVEEAVLVGLDAVPALLTPDAAAASLGISRRTLEGWRIKGGGPCFVRLSRSTIRYTAEALATFVQARVKANTAR